MFKIKINNIKVLFNTATRSATLNLRSLYALRCAYAAAKPCLRVDYATFKTIN